MQPLKIDTPEQGTIRQLADDLYWARFPLPFRLNHINLYMIDTKDGWVLIDAGIHNEITATIWTQLLDGPLAGKPIAKIIITHHHVDHIGYVAELSKRTSAPVFTSADEIVKSEWMMAQEDDEFAALLDNTYRSYGLGEEIREQAKNNKGRFRRYVAPLPPLLKMDEGEVIISTDGVFKVRIDKGHSQAQIGLVDEKRGLYLAVDFLLPRISPNIPVDMRDLEEDMLGHYLHYLEEMTNLPDEWHILPGHDWPFSHGGQRAQALIDHHNMRLDALIQAAETAPISVSDAMAVLFGKEFGAHEMYFAAGEARSHLTHLLTIGKMGKSTENGIDRFYNLI